MKFVRKYTLNTDRLTYLDLPSDCEILDVRTLDGRPHLFILLDKPVTNSRRIFAVIGEDHPINEQLTDAVYIGMFTQRALSSSEPREAPRDMPSFVFELVEPITNTARQALQETSR